MLFYVISPTKNTHLMLHGDRIFGLAHLYTTNADYKKFIDECRADGRFITMDNGAAEKSLVTEDSLLAIVAELRPNEVISPDVLFDKDATLANLTSFIQKMKDGGHLEYTKIFGCPQGKTKEEWLECYKVMLDTPEVSVIGLSKIAVPMAYMNATNDASILEARNLCFDELNGMGLIKKPLHFLGMGDPREFLHYKNEPLARSTDSCYTVLSAIKGLSWEDGQYQRIPTPHDYFDIDMTPAQITLAHKNISYFWSIMH